jgi:hypothetical protein
MRTNQPFDLKLISCDQRFVVLSISYDPESTSRDLIDHILQHQLQLRASKKISPSNSRGSLIPPRLEFLGETTYRLDNKNWSLGGDGADSESPSRPCQADTLSGTQVHAFPPHLDSRTKVVVRLS